VADEEKEVTDEPETLQEEREGLNQEKERLNSQLRDRETTIQELQETLTARDTEISELKQVIAESEGKLAQVNDLLSRAVASYRELTAALHPEIPPELITGDSVAAVDESIKGAQALVEKVKRSIEAETLKARVPAGAPPRTPPDLSVLSPREKIEYAIGGSSSRR
jgi:chromosome segregation ATPase